MLKLIKENVQGKEEQEKAVSEVAMRCIIISSMLYSAAKPHLDEAYYKSQRYYCQEMLDKCCAARDILYVLGDNIDNIFGDSENLHAPAVAAWEEGIKKHKNLMRYLAEKEVNKEEIMLYVAKIQKYHNSYQVPEINVKSGGCYVATAVYGSYDCPQVWTLRRYRDYTLAETWYGRVFVCTYYTISPTLVKWFGHTNWFKKMWKGKLDRMVAKLQKNGIESTPYNDKEW